MSERLEIDPLSPPPNGWQTFWSLVTTYWKFGAAILGIPTVLGTAYHYLTYFIPVVDISIGLVGSEINPLATEFVVTNKGNVTIYQVEILCDIFKAGSHIRSGGNFISTPDRTMNQVLALLSPSASATRNCGSSFPYGSVTLPATFIVDVTAKYPWPYPVLNFDTSARFIGLIDSDHHVHVTPDSQ